MNLLYLAIIVILIPLGTIVPPVYSQLTNTIATNQNSGPISLSVQPSEIKFESCDTLKETFLINGTINLPISNSPVVIKIQNPNGTTYDSERISPSQVSHDGKYWYSLNMTYGNGEPVGPYDITVSYNSHSAKTSIHLVMPIIERAPPTNTIRIVDSNGNNLSAIKVGQQVQIEDSIQPVCGEQKFAYIVQVQDSNAATVSLSWIQGSFVGSRPMNFSETWTPFAAGNYTVERYLWSSIASPNALQPPVARTVEVG